jgi:SAM-dependent MidA family methyltransferase
MVRAGPRGAVRWREAMASALYGADGFYTRPGPGPAAHFRTSAHASPLFAEAVLRLLERVDEALGRPDPVDVVDVGAGRGELLSALCAAAPPPLAARLRATAVEMSAEHGRTTAPAGVTGLLVATEWLDNVPVEVAEVDGGGVVRYVLVDPATGEEVLGEPVSGPDADWLARWWPLSVPGTRAELGRPRDEAWAGAVGTVARGAALAVDYGHLGSARPPLGTLTAFRNGREVPPVPDGSCDLTAHVAFDALADAHRSWTPVALIGATNVQDREVLTTQRDALRALGLDGARPPLALARRDPAGYLRRLAAASSVAELTEPAGLGGHYWLLQPVGLDPDVARWLA